jgi:DNA repair protein SbcC/Rad50
MVPVRLALRNFLSYGEAAEPLDFEQFHVACLSGGNGQGKSALLDALTWALWGQARKSGEARKPDEELLRTGAREMEVDLTFDIEGERYRVVRSFYRTASGKTTKPGLELQVRDATTDGWRTLTAPSVAETQAAIERTIRLDYDTFINSAFLLQGRSDEFTRKKPSERKQILARILGLDRFERLEQAARERALAAEKAAELAEAEADRLKEALAEEPALRDGLAEASAEAAAHADARDALRQEATALAERLADLEAVARHAGERRARLQTLTRRRAELAGESADLTARLEGAEALITQADTIRRDHERFRALDAERSGLDDLRDQQQGLRQQELHLERELQQARQAHETRITRLEASLNADRSALVELRGRVAERPAREAALAEARAAAAEADALRARRDARKRREETRDELERRLAYERGALQAAGAEARRQVRAGEEAARALPAFRQACAEGAQVAARLAELREQKEHAFEEGSEIGARLAAARTELERIAADLAGLEERAARLESLETEACPTCGTALTDAHRAEVRRTYDAERTALTQREASVRQAEARLAEERRRVGGRYKGLEREMAPLAEAEAAASEARARLDAALEAEAALEGLRARADLLERQLADEAFAPEVQAQLTQVLEALEAEPFDTAHFESVLNRASQAPRLEAELRDLAAAADRLAELARQAQQREGELARLREEAASGAAEGPARTRLDTLRQQLKGLGYDPARHEAVRRELHALREAPERFVRLGAALANAAEWRERRLRLEEEATRTASEAEVLEAALAADDARLAERPARLAEQAASAARLSEAEAALHAAQDCRAALRARLDQCGAWRARLAEVREAHREARRERTIHTHLRRAFGRNGIPALLIEQTLPEVEERANALLERLSNGRTRVHLETLRDKKAGGTRETLDIRITDEQGAVRSYETFSGGEAFRVNFALRIALAQLLADRAGVRIRTLVVDEGFGTQDRQGIEALVEAIQTVHGDFEKVIVITHLDELKEAFPVRIEVRKDPVLGSRYDLVGV